MAITTTDRLKELLPQLFNDEKLEGSYYLRFQLTNDISGLIDLKYVRESLNIDGDRITAVPNLPEYVVGLMSSRNQVFLAVDLAHLVGLPPQTVNLRQYQTIVVQVSESQEKNFFGLTVNNIQGISRRLPEQFSNDLKNVPDLLRPFVTGSTLLQISEDAPDSTTETFAIDIAKLITTKIKA